MMQRAVGRSASSAASLVGSIRSCSSCKSRERENLVSLDCQEHFLCKECLRRKVGKDASSMFLCTFCSTVAGASTAPIAVLVDHDNLLLEAQKFGGRRFGRGEQFRDHRVRVDYKKLGDFVAGTQRREIVGKIFNSRGVYVNDKRFSLVFKERSSYTGGQKEVDTAICVEIMDLLSASTAPSTIVLISGDRDISPAILKALEAGWIVEIYMWTHNTATCFRELARQNDKCKYIPLDGYFQDIISFNYFAIDFKSSDEESTVVVTVDDSKFKEDEKVYTTRSEWWKRLEALSQWPVQYKWLKSVPYNGAPSTPYVLNEPRLILVFRGLEVKKTKELLSKIPSFEEATPHSKPCEMYTDFQRRFERGRSKSLPTTPSETWSEVSSKRSTPRNRPHCCSGKNCEEGLKCGFFHTKDEKDYFIKHGGRGNIARKTRLCRQNPCRTSREACDFAHKESDDGWCSVCHKTGHFRKPTCQKCNHVKHIPTQAATALLGLQDTPPRAAQQ